jgi:uncharacterized protein (TIGR03437 family)
MMLAAPATGPVDAVWFSVDGTQLFGRTHSGRVFQTSDFENWTPAADMAPLNPWLPVSNARRLPENGARVLTTGWNQARLYALGRNLYRSDDGGESWTNLTAFKSLAVIGPGQRSLAISQANPDQLVVSNGFGVWRSMDGGLSWTGLNHVLPNLTIRRIVSTPSSSAGTRVVADDAGTLELSPGGSVWQPAAISELETEAARLDAYSKALKSEITATASSGNVTYVGSTDGRIWVSVNSGPFQQTQTPQGTAGRVERIFFDGRVALAALSGKGPHVLRNANNLPFWDALDGNLPDIGVHSVTADRASGAIYIATDRGVFWATTELESAATVAVNWTSLSDKLPAVSAADVQLDPARVQLYAALDGYGVFATPAPHRLNHVRLVNTADYSNRPAAPGSLVTVIGGRVDSARGANLAYPVLQVLGNDSQLQVPFEAVGPSVALDLQIAGGTVRRDLPVQPVSPAILVGRDGVPMLWDADSGLPLDVRNPVRANGRLQIWATGLGRVRPDWPAGLPAPIDNSPVVAATVRAFLNGSAVQVTSAKMLPGYVGFYLVEVQLPSIVNDGPAQLYITADNQESNHVLLSMEQ